MRQTNLQVLESAAERLAETVWGLSTACEWWEGRSEEAYLFSLLFVTHHPELAHTTQRIVY